MSNNFKPFKCSICQKRFSTTKTKADHVVVVHENAGRHKCEHCVKTFQGRSHLVRHARIHRTHTPFACEVCQMQFQYENTLNTHLNLHSETFQCEQCPKSFPSSHKLQRHFLNCHAEKTFICGHCTKGFGRKAALQRHLQTHSSKPFKCRQRKRKWDSKEDPPYRSKIQRKTSGGGHSTGGKDELTERIEPGDASCSLVDTAYSLRVRRQIPDYSAGIEPNERSEQGESDEENGQEDEAEWCGGLLNEKEQNHDRVGDSEDWAPDREVRSFVSLISDSQQTIEGNSDSDGQTGNDVNKETDGHESRQPPQIAIPVITLSSDESDQEDELPPQPLKLKLVFDLEYKAPN